MWTFIKDPNKGSRNGTGETPLAYEDTNFSQVVCALLFYLSE